ncbi:MAG: 4Fe-4S binding protein [Chloroflexota bacterium]
MPRYGLLIDYEFCVGCHACEVACQQEHHRAQDEPGITVLEVPPDVSGGKWYYIPFPTDRCKRCGKRIARGKAPACVQNCWVGVMKFGKIEEMAAEVQKKPRMVLWSL